VRQTKAEIYLHLVWATWRRQPLVTEEIERAVYRCIEKEVRRLQCNVLAIGGMPDHVHLVVKIRTTVSAAQLAQKVKGVSSTLARDQLLPPDTFFGWQDGYAVFSISRNHVKRVIAYVEDQKRHHSKGTLWTDWEETDEEYEQARHNPSSRPTHKWVPDGRPKAPETGFS
jgi:putative transposase